MLSCEICEILKNAYFEEHLQTTAAVISKSWMHTFIQICLCQKGIWTIAHEENCLPVRVSVWVRVRISFRVGGQFSLGTIILEPRKELRFVSVKTWWKYEIDHFPIRIFRRYHNSKKISTQQYFLLYRSSHPELAVSGNYKNCGKSTRKWKWWSSKTRLHLKRK